MKDVADLTITIVKEFCKGIHKLQSGPQRRQFAIRTNIYRAEDGRPICYCCLKVGNVAKYCWNRKFSCQHFRQSYDAIFTGNSSASDTFVVASLTDDTDRKIMTQREFEEKMKDLQYIVEEIENWEIPQFVSSNFDTEMQPAVFKNEVKENMLVKIETSKNRERILKQEKVLAEEKNRSKHLESAEGNGASQTKFLRVTEIT